MEKWSFQRTRELMTPRALRGMAVNDVGRARISMMVRSMSSNSRPDTLVQDRTPQPHRFFLQRTAGPYIGVKRFQTICELARDRSSYFETEEPIAATISLTIGFIWKLSDGPMLTCPPSLLDRAGDNRSDGGDCRAPKSFLQHC